MKIDSSFTRLQPIINLQQKAEKASHEKIESFSWLQKGHPLGPPPTKVDALLLAKLAGDKLCNDRVSGGYEFSACLDYFSAFIEQILENPIMISKETLPKLKKIQELMQRGRAVASELERVIQDGIPRPGCMRGSGDVDLSRFCGRLAKKIKKKEELWLPINWEDARGNPYAILVHVHTGCEVTIYNTGQDVDDLGRNIIERGEVKEEIRFQQVVTIRNVNRDRLENETFLKVLFELACRPMWENNFCATEGLIIKPLETFLQGKRDAIRDFDKEPEMFKKPSRSNFPIIKTITSAIYYLIGDRSEYKKLKFLWQTQALVAYDGACNEFVKEVVDNISRSSQKLDLDPSYLQAFDATAVDVLLRIDRGSVTTSELLEPMKAETISTVTKQSFNVQFEGKGVKGGSHYEQDLEKSLVVQRVQKQYEELLPGRSFPEIDEIPQFLKRLLEITTFYETDEQTLNNIFFDQFAECILQLPDPGRVDHSYWKGVSEEYITDCMNIIYSLIRHVIDLSDKTYRVKNAIVLYKLFAINCELGQSCPESTLKEYKYNPDGLTRYATWDTYVIKEAKYQQQMAKILDYFYPGYKISDGHKYTYDSLFNLSCNSAYYFNESSPTRALLSHFLDQILADPSKKERLYNKSTYKLQFRGGRKADILKKLHVEDPYSYHLGALMSESIDETSLLPHSVHLLLQSYLALNLYQSFKKGFIGRHKGYFELKARCHGDRDGKDMSVEVPYGYGRDAGWDGSERNNEIRRHGSYCVNSLIHDEKKVLQQTLDISREVLMIDKDPYDEVTRAFGFMKKWPNLIKNEDVQDVMESHLFRYGRLLSQVYDNSKVVLVGADIIKKLIGHYIHLNDGKTAIFLTRLGMHLAFFVSGKNIKEPLPDFKRIMVEEVIPNFSDDPHILVSCYQAILSVYACMEPEKLQANLFDVTNHLYSYLLYQQITCQKSCLESKQLYHLLITHIADLLNDDTKARQEILNAFVKKFLPTFEEQKWSGTFPRFDSDRYQVDMHAIKIKSSDGDLFTTLPIDVQEDDVFRKIFRGKVITCTSNESDHILIINKGMEDELKIDTERLKYFKKINGHLCQYIPTPELFYWNHIQNHKTECWIRQVRGRDFIIHIIENGTREICYAKIERDEKEPSSFTMHCLERGDDSVLQLVFNPPTPTSIERMEEFKQDRIEYWTDEEGKLRDLRLQTTGLLFRGREVEGETRIVSKDYPGYYLVKDIKVPLSMKRYLTLQNQTGDRKVLFLFFPYLIDYDVVDGELTSKELHGKLVLLCLWLKIDEYTKAYNLLKQIVPLQNIKDQEHCGSMVGPILELLLARKRNKHPMNNALLLHFVLFTVKNNLKFPQKEEDLEPFEKEMSELIAKRYVDVYCQNRHNLAGFLLSFEEERMLVECLISSGVGYFLEGRVSLFLSKKPNLGRYLLSPASSRQKKTQLLDKDKLISAFNRGKTGWAFTNEEIIKEESYFLKHFFHLYDKSIKYSEELKRFLDLNCMHAHCPYYRCLKMVAERPENYPAVVNDENLNDVISHLKKELNSRPHNDDRIKTIFKRKKGKWILFDHHLPVTKAITKRSTLHLSLFDVDEFYNAYFQKLFIKFFSWHEEKVVFDMEELPTSHPNPDVQKELQKENADLTYYRQQLPEKEKKYSLSEGKTLSQLKKRLEDRSKSLSERLKTAKVALLWFIKKGSWQDVKRATLLGNTDETFHNAVAEFLVHSTRLNQMKSVIKMILQIKHFDERFLPEIVNGLLQKRAYTASTSSFDKLWFEEANGFFYRENQLAKLVEITPAGRREVLGEMPTAFGKSKALVPALDYRKSKEGKLVFNTWPGSLEITNTYDIQELMFQSFAMKVDRIAFTRSTPITVRTLAYLYQDLLENLKTGQPVNIRSESLRALELHTILYLYEDSGKEEELVLMFSILRLIRTRGWSTIDESHLTLDPMDKLIYTLGTPTPMPMEHVLLIQDFCDFLIQGKLDMMIGIRDNLQFDLSKEDFEDVVIPMLIHYFNNLFEISDSSFIDFLTGEIPESIERSPKRGLLALAKGLLMQLLEVSVQGSVNENLGLSKFHIEKIEFAIPYIMANTPKETKDNPTQYKNPHETLLKTFFTYLYEGLSLSQVKKIIASLKDQAFDESIDDLPLSKTKASRFFQSLVVDKRYHLCALTEKEIVEVAKIIRKKKITIFYYIQMYVIPELKTYPLTIVSTVHNFRSQFAGCLSFSATPQDPIAHSIDTHFVPMKGTSGQVTHLLLTKCKDPKTLHPLKSKTPKAALDESLEIVKENPRIHACLDIGAHFKGLSNQEVAAKILKFTEKDENVQAVLFFDDRDGLFKVKDKSTGQVHTLSDVDPDYTYTYYDQSRCFGSDITQAIDAAALLMTSKSTTKASAGQGAGRMRKWHQQQTVEVAYPEEMDRDIKKLIVQWIVNGLKKKKIKNYMNLIQQMDNVKRRAVLDNILNSTPEQARKLLHKHKSEFITEDSQDPWELYAHLPKEVDTKKYLLSYLKAKNLKIDPKVWENMILPEKIQAKTAGIGMECEVLLELNAQQETEVEEQVESDDKKIEREKSNWKRDLNLFVPGWEKPHPVYLVNVVRDIAFKKIPSVFEEGGQMPLTSLGVVAAGVSLVGASLPVNKLALRCFTGFAGLVLAYAGVESFMWSKRAYLFEMEFFSAPNYLWQYLPSKIAAGANLFSDNLIVSKNLYPIIERHFISVFIHGTTHFKFNPQTPFQRDQKPLFSVLVIRDETWWAAPKFTVALIDQNDSEFIHEKLKLDIETTSKEDAAIRKRKVGLYDLTHNMFTVEGKNTFTDKDIDHPAFWNLIGQAKFLNGQIKFEPKEEEHFGAHLDRKILKIGLPTLQSLYVDNILQNRPLYKKSIVENMVPRWIAQKLHLNENGKVS